METTSYYVLRDESTGEEVVETEGMETKEVEYDNEDLVENVILGLQAIRVQLVKVLSESKKIKWSSVS